MRLQTMSNIGRVPEELVVGRGDPVYMAHGYLTKVPVPAIIPFIEAYTEVGDVVVDPFAGSGMTGVAAAATGRRARLYDISVLGQHIGRNYLNAVDPELLRKLCDEVIRGARERLGNLYDVECQRCHGRAELTKAIWSAVVKCDGCDGQVTFYRALETADWAKKEMACPRCAARLHGKSERVGEEPVVDSIRCSCSSSQREQTSRALESQPSLDDLVYPRVDITPDRQMYQAQALGRSGLTTVASFYSPRNLLTLTALRDEIATISDDQVRAKLMFAFTACLTRASKRYQWSQKRPLNAANANYYVAPVFYEWNVYDLFQRKVEAAIRADRWIAQQRAQHPVGSPADTDVIYEVGTAERIPLADSSVDYVFTDPPFGSNLFYADMALFQEAWLGGFTDVSAEAVISRGADREASTARYERILTSALRECRRILKPGGRLSLVFGNSTGAVWSLLQRVISNAGLAVEPDELVVLDKGQRSVKGLASGFEHVATLDLIITMTAATDADSGPLVEPPDIAEAVRSLAADATGMTPSHLYLELLRRGFRSGWDLSRLDLRAVTAVLRADGWELDASTGKIRAARRSA